MAPPESKAKRILVVEDEAGYQELIQEILGGGMFDVTLCSTAEDALVKLGAERFDLIITDINMLGMTGFEVMGKVRAAGLAEACPVVFCSSQFDPETKAKALSMGAAGFIPKPYQYEMVVSTVRSLLGGGA